MKVSVITPYYQGREYLDRYCGMMEQNRSRLEPGDELEVLLINDSPWEKVVLPGGERFSWIRILENEKNRGIHASRVAGLACALGESVLFLDQDDELAPEAIRRMIGEAKSHPGSVIVSNAVLEQEKTKELWYRTPYHKRQIGNLKTYLTVGIQIISPGQCLIPKESVPELWTRRICRKNGADDYLLWLLLLQEKVPFVFLDAPLYIHKYTAKNLSADTKVTDASAYEFLDMLKEEQAMPEKSIRTLRRMLRYKDAFRNGSGAGKLLESLKNPDLFAANVIFKLRSRTPYGFNRGC